ncbi:type IX secretion system membrane protein, PorP/SprF family [Filimonas lacunae]|uniref:Type IX secretion system membrane protein, PorP/SprF family n=1 Tax=Filimonas lacunae TaxID=477680 RepID=A0A173MBA2_9BACT|nr:PorP/SprF family type IX secretion system membrane protein [Filimonas lacunae]BAV04779.1 hypothetical protein FLA_0778 [Filimonas lacunae]SIT32092.1 type IX secretion system membrane protein, PorP/SprF family [Filimonas lacunae]
MKYIISYLFLLAGCLLFQKGAAQVDAHFTQYYVYPSWLNPALTGVFDGDYRVSGIYRSQWGNVSSPFTTTGLSGDIKTGKNLSIGLQALVQRAGNGGYRYTTGAASVNYTGVRFGKSGYHRLNLALQAGFLSKRFDPAKFTFGEQWTPGGIVNINSEVLTRNSATSFDAGAGMLYYDAEPGKKANVYAGFSVAHLTRPEDRFSASGNEKLPLRYNLHAGVKIVMSPAVTLTPNVLYLKQGSASEKAMGLYAQMKAALETDFLVGVNYRIEDAVSPYVGFNYKSFVVGASYDVNISDLGKLAKGASSFELTLTYTGRKKVRTPEADFVCPRL